MKRYSVAPTSSRRKSTLSTTVSEDTAAAREELEKLEQETTLVLQEIDKNISRANGIINDRLIPIIKDYSNASKNVWSNAGFWKFFFEQSANVELNSYEDPISTTDVNTIANSRSNMLFNEDEDEDEELHQEAPEDPAHDTPHLDVFKKPTLKPQLEESTPTWSVEQSKKQIQSSTPQLHKRPSLLPGYNRHPTAYDSNDSIGTQPPPLLTTSISSTESQKSPEKDQSPVKTQTVRQSLDTYHKLSISPRKARTATRNALVEDARRRSSLIQNLINSSPTLPEPPILRSELANVSELSSPTKEERQLSEVEQFSPVLLPPELSPTKSVALSSHSKENTIQRNTIQRFPSTPKFSERLSDGGKLDIMKTPLGLQIKYGDEDSDLQPPELQNIDLHEGLASKRNSDQALSSAKRAKPNDDNDNVFLETGSRNTPNNASAGSTVYHSMLNKHERPSADNTDNQTQSKSISQIFDDILNKAPQNQSGTRGVQRKGITSTEIKDIFSDVSGSLLENSQLDNTENSTSELGSMLRERFNNLTNYGRKQGD
ncbi:uncharacterized protein CANTADRAFT_24542, partial [Suhomyces tanzawaensis NRRL Y-17324]